MNAKLTVENDRYFVAEKMKIREEKNPDFYVFRLGVAGLGTGG